MAWYAVLGGMRQKHTRDGAGALDPSQYQGMDRNRIVASLPLELSDLPQDTTVTAGTGEPLHVITAGSSIKVSLESLPTYFACAMADGEALEAKIRAAVLVATASQ